MADKSQTLTNISEAWDNVFAELDREKREAMAAAGPWPRWRCRIGWHKPVNIASGPVGALHELYIRQECAGGCDAYWLSRNRGPFFRADR